MMENKSEQSSFVSNIVAMFQTFFLILKQIGNLFLLESRLARKSLGVIFIMCLAIFISFSSLWILCISMLLLWLSGLMHSLMAALFTTVILHIILLTGFVLYISNLSKNLRFTYTRQQLFQWRQKDVPTALEKRCTADK